MNKSLDVIETLPPIKFDVTKAAIIKLKKQCDTFVDAPANPADYKKLTTQIALVRNTRTSIEKRRRELKAPLLTFGRKVDVLAKSLTASLQDMETPLVDLKVEADQEKLREREAKANAERERLESLNAKLEEIRNHAIAATWPGIEPENIKQSITDLEALVIDKEGFQELAPIAEIARQETLMKLRQQLVALKTQQAEDLKRQQEIKELEINQKAQAKIEAERRARQVKIEAEQQAQQKKLDEQQAIMDAKFKKTEEAEAKVIREANEKAAAAKLKKMAAEQKREQAAYQKKLVPELRTVRAWLVHLGDTRIPEVTLDETRDIVKYMGQEIDAAMVETDNLLFGNKSQ